MVITTANPDGERSISPLVGLVLLFGMVAIGAAVLLVAGSVAVDSIQQRASVDAAELSMHEIDASVGDSASGPVRVDLGERDGTYRVVQNGTLSFTINEQTSCSNSMPLGSVRYEDRDGNRLAYEAGGIWKQTDSGAVMVSPPQIRHADGQLYVGVTNVSGQFEGDEATLRTADSDDEGSDFVRELYDATGCYPAENITITVESEFYEAWGRYFAETLNESTTTVDPAAGTASVRLPIDSTYDVVRENDSIRTSMRFDATVEVLGTELSGISSDNVIYGPTTFRVVAQDDVYTPWPDGDPDDGLASNPADDDLNDPTENETRSYSLHEYPAGTSITVRATSWSCDWYTDAEDTGEDLLVGGSYYDQWRCTDLDSGDERIAIDSTGESSNLVVLTDGEQVPDFSEGGPEQRNLSAILGSRIDDQGRLQLAQNQFVFLYELSEQNADPDDADGSGDPDYNDAVVLVTIEQAWSNTADYSIRIERDQVVVDEEDDDPRLAFD
ncbi:DUF7289 family protein [Haloarchaeobius sp. HRN-SO-5]|uniref:DUF7289 family protein n=1 Tax=Haloarchaeobius sp. HRN-SO-5 TaxID=3446118 RepID=UPI003EB798AE